MEKKVEITRWQEIVIVVVLAIAGSFGIQYSGIKGFLDEVFTETDRIVEENEYYIEKIEDGVIYLKDRFGNKKTVVEVDTPEVEVPEVEQEIVE